MRKDTVILLALLLISGACSKAPEPHVPVIGISCSRSDTGKDELLPAYSSAFTRAGATVFIIPTIATEQEARNIIASLDGILISGGVSVNPAWYGEEILNETVWVDPVRDLSDSLLVRSALASGMPILAICRGSQLLNVMQGGSLPSPPALPTASLKPMKLRSSGGSSFTRSVLSRKTIPG